MSLLLRFFLPSQGAASLDKMLDGVKSRHCGDIEIQKCRVLEGSEEEAVEIDMFGDAG